MEESDLILHMALGILPESGPESDIDKLNENYSVTNC